MWILKLRNLALIGEIIKEKQIKTLEMSSDISQSPENGCASLEDLRTKKNLKSAVIADDDKLKIKLKISRTELNKKESVMDVKAVKTSRNVLIAKSELRNGDEKSGGGLVLQDDDVMKISNAGEPKMKLRSKREADEDGEHRKLESQDGAEEKKRIKEYWNEKEVEKPWKKRKKTIKYRIDDSPEKGEEGSRRRSKRNEGETELDKSMETIEEAKEVNKESFCWTCHKDGSVLRCDTCPRVFHLKCVSLTKDPSKDWICPECSLVLHAEKMSTRSEAMKSLSLDQLCTLLSFAIGRMKNVPESEAFWKPVDPKEVPYYDKYITNPMDLNLLEKNMKAKMYGSPQAFLADAKWLLHNSIIFNSNQSPLTSTARFLVKICRQEMAEIENCPDCYLNAHTKDEWFVEVCRKPHILIWARLKGFPFWPAKAMSTNLKTQQVDARFFGAHDKAWVPVKECYLYSKNSPQVLSKKRTDLDDAFMEVESYIKKIRQKYGVFCYAPDKTPFMPEMYDKQLQAMIPTYKDEKAVKKKRKSDQSFEENGTVDKPCQNGKKVAGQVTPQRHQLKRQTSYDAPKLVGDVCHMSDYVSEEKVINDDGVSPEDEIAKSLEMFDTHKRVEEVLDENSSDLDDDASLPIPEHGYSRNSENVDVVQSSSASNELENKSAEISGEQEEKLIENSTPVDGKTQNTCESECVAESSDETKRSQDFRTEEKTCLKTVNDQCEVSSTSADLKVAENEDREDVNEQRELDSSGVDDKSDVRSGPNCQEPENDCKEKSSNIESGKKDDERSQKSFVNLTCDQKQKILTEAKLLANIDELSALGKQKVLNELGLDASKVDIRQLAQENRQILETLNKKHQNEGKGFEEVSIKNEDFEQYLMEENNEENIFDEDIAPTPPQLASIRMRDFHMLSKDRDKGSGEPVVQIMDVHSLRELGQTTVEHKSKRKKSFDDPAKKLKLEPVVELIRLDPFDKSVSRLNRKLRLSDEVSLMMVDGEKRVNVNVGAESVEPEAQKSVKKTSKAVRARKGLPNRAKSSSREISKNINVISVDTENSTAQKNLLKSLCLEEKKPEESVRKTVFITTNEKGIKNVDFKSSCEPTIKKQIKEVTIESMKDTGKGNEMVKEGNSSGQKNLSAITNSHLIVTNSCPAIGANQNSQPNLALAQNNTGQLSLVHLSNLTSGIQTNFVNLTNETIGFNPVGTLVSPLVATSGLKSEFPSSSGTSSVILNPSLTTSLSNSTGNGSASKGGKSGGDSIKLSINRVGSSKSSSGISVKSPNSLGLNASQASNLLSFVTPQGEGVSFAGDLGPVTAELNKHSMKMAEHMRSVIEDMLRELSNQGSLEAKYKLLTIEMEKLQWRHQQELLELKHHSERSMMELRTSLETEKQKCLGELKAQLESQHQKVISETKRKQWCANCGKEALFYCCWNTSYCDYPCQQRHWPGHMNTCAQLGNNVTMGSSTGSQLQSKTPGIKYQNSSYVPNMSRGGSIGGERSGSGHGAVSSCNTGNGGGGSMTTNRSIPAVQAEASHMRRSSDPSLPPLPVNITIRPQHYFM